MLAYAYIIVGHSVQKVKLSVSLRCDRRLEQIEDKQEDKMKEETK